MSNQDLEIWSNADPRNVFSQCNRSYGTIIIVRPNLLVGTADVYVEYGWSIRTSFKDHKSIDMNSKWDPIWKWTLAP